MSELHLVSILSDEGYDSCDLSKSINNSDSPSGNRAIMRHKLQPVIKTDLNERRKQAQKLERFIELNIFNSHFTDKYINSSCMKYINVDIKNPKPDVTVQLDDKYIDNLLMDLKERKSQPIRSKLNESPKRVRFMRKLNSALQREPINF